MGRPLKGSRWERNGSFYASLPAVLLTKRRIEAAFDDERARNAWLGAGIAALKAGRPVPDPDLFRRGRLPVVVPEVAEGPPMPDFETLAYGWLDEHYGRLRRADAEREHKVRTIVETHLVPAFGGPIPADAAAARSRLIDFVRRLAAEPEWQRDANGAQVEGDTLLTVAEAEAFCARSESTIRRALRARRLPGARRGGDGEWRIPAADLANAGIGRAAEASWAKSRAYVTDILWAHAKILDWGRHTGWQIPEFERDVIALTPDDEVLRKRSDAAPRQPLSVAELVPVAGHLHVVHQLTLWLMRVLGLRIGEAFGPRVGDVIDFGEFGLIHIGRQGGRRFLTRTRRGVETSYSKDTLKRRASYRFIVVPASLMVVIRVVVEAFHTDPETGEVDLDARLVPWIVKDGRGQSAFRAAFDAALVLEGFDFDTTGLEVTTHHLRKSLATDLAWNGELDELAKRRVMGHKAGDDVFARVYTLDHPTLVPLVAVAQAVEATIAEAVPSLLVPTERRVAWAGANPIRHRRSHVDAVLAETGWQVEPGGEDNPWCETEQVAAELGVGITTARRWMREGFVPSTSDRDEHGNPRRRARLADVRRVKERLAGRILLRDLARDMGVGYQRAWQALRRLGTEPARDPRTDELLLTEEQAAALRAEFARLGHLSARSMRLGAAATALGVSYLEVRQLIHGGELVEDEERDAFGARYVTRASVEALRLRRGATVPPMVGADVVSLATVVELTGLSAPQVMALADERLLELHEIRRRMHVTVASLRAWATGYRPDLLPALGSEAAVHDDEEAQTA